MGATLAAGHGRRRRLRRRRHGRHELRHLPRARRPARDQDRLELALPLLHRPADGRRAERRRRRRLDRPGAPGRAARRARSRRARRPARSATAAAATRPTVTDADAVLGYLPADGFAGGRMTLDVDAARAAIERDVAEPLGLDVVEAAWGIERIVNANMANATRKVLAGHGADPRDLALIAYGGNGAVHAWAIARRARHRPRSSCRRPRPRSPRSACSSPTTSSTSCARTSSPLSQVDLGRLRDADARARRRGRARSSSRPASTAGADASHALYMQMCYPGQNFDMSVPVPEGDALDEPGLLDLAERFHDQHEAERGLLLPQPAAAGARRAPRRPAARHRSRTTSPSSARVTDADRGATGTAPAYFGDELRRHARSTTAPRSARAPRSTGPR